MKLLVVEDEALLRHHLFTRLGEHGHVVDAVADAEEALYRVSEYNHDEIPKISHIRVKITAGEETDINSFEQGMTDVLVTKATEAGRYVDEGISGMYQYTSNEYDFIGFNFQKELFQDRALRQAVAYALPKENLMDIRARQNWSRNLLECFGNRDMSIFRFILKRI